MSVVADLNNERDEFPKLDMNEIMNSDKLFQSEDWRYVIKRNCKTIVLNNINHTLVSVLKIRGVIYDLVNPNLDTLYIYGVRCPIHSTEKIGKVGNKTIIDIIFSTDPSCIKVSSDSKTGICDVKFPDGFSPICYTSENCQFQYLSCVSRPINLLAVDISPISFTLLWNTPGKCNITIKSDKKTETIKNQIQRLEVVNLEPNTEYKITVCSEEDYRDSHSITLTTHEFTRKEMNKLYKSKKDENGLYDISSISPPHVKYLRTEGIISSEDKVNIKGELENIKCIYSCGVVKAGETGLANGDCNFYVIPDFDIDEEQFFCLESMGVSHMLHFDKSESYVKYNNQVYPHNSKFQLEKYMVSVAKGSIILILFEDDDPLPFPGGTITAEQVQTSGDLVMKDLLCRSMSQVTSKVIGDVSYGVSSFFVYDSLTSSSLECTRMSHGLSDNKETGSITMNVLYTNPSSVQSIVQSIGTSAENTSFTARTDDTDELTSTFGVDGLSFDTNEGNIFFGSGKEFRIHYEESAGLDPATLQIQKLSGGSYVSSFIVTAEPP